MKKLDETSLPPKDAFYSKLTGEGITDEDYQRAQTALNEFNIETMKDYHNLYNLSDVLLLADIFENFRNICMNHYRLDSAWYFRAPGLAWDAALKIIKVQLELLNDPDILTTRKSLRPITISRYRGHTWFATASTALVWPARRHGISFRHNYVIRTSVFTYFAKD